MPIDDIMKYITTNEIKWVNICFSDVFGRFYRCSISSSKLTDDHFKTGIYVEELSKVFSDFSKELIIMPDIDSFARVPWDQSTVRLMGYILNRKKEHFLLDTRYAAKRTEATTSALGFNSVKVGSTFDFTILENVSIDRISQGFGGTVYNSRESNVSPAPYVPETPGIYSNEPADIYYTTRLQLADMVNEGFNMVVSSHEHGRGAGQQTFSLVPLGLVEGADTFQSVKHGTKMFVISMNAFATFMPYIFDGSHSNRMLISQSLWKKGNVLYDSTDEYAQVSQIARYYIGGILEHLGAIVFFTMPTVNSYKCSEVRRAKAGWSANDSSAVVHIPYGKVGDRHKKRVTFTLADPSVNPYLAYSVLVAAGLDGIRHKIDPGDPIEKESKRKRSKIPTSLLEAKEAFESDKKFLSGVLSNGIMDIYAEHKYKEAKEVENKITQWEVVKYFDV